ncbi:RNA polymerase sigma factor [Sulfurospirillum halorespirans]|uniref:Putative RNA polymerase sigma factor n=1 Tax=Sulfurospirillum halorespirans DSM 13726 TaxID=1193502 RepID=A0A1D7TNC9_9BACT|nr:RNA polymerase sigma factor [Sulfurospirillum halorespirans]AOO66508.1 putative RNA polymerase sigma factor [Sulfurospirillum halorespirans DSM 13726]
MLKYYKELVYFVQKMVGDRELAMDITQETYAKTIEKSKDVIIENERAFLYKVARNIVIDATRREKNRTFIAYEEEHHCCNAHEQPDAIVFESLKDAMLVEALGALPRHLKHVFVLHVIEGYSKKEIASMLNLNLNSVQKYIISATAKLTEYIQHKEWNDA